MGKDLGGREFVDATMAEGTRGDEVVTDANDVLNITEMGDAMNVSKMEVLENSTKNRQ